MSHKILTEIAQREGDHPAELRPRLHEAIDPEMLNCLCCTDAIERGGHRPRSSFTITATRSVSPMAKKSLLTSTRTGSKLRRR